MFESINKYFKDKKYCKVVIHCHYIYLFRRKNWKKYITFTVLIEKEVTRIDKNVEEITKNISYILQFIDSTRFMAR